LSFPALRFDVAAAEADAWSDALIDAGALAVDVSDPSAGTAEESPLYGEPGMAHGDMAQWTLARLAVLCAAGTAVDVLLDRAAATLGASAPPHESYSVAEQDWVRATQAQFGPIAIAPDFWIVPSWCASPDPRALCIELDPGLAFGTGSHATTRLCLLWLRGHLRREDRVLDYGCGSGILAIAAAKLGAAEVTGIDVDPQALDTSRENAARNGVEARFLLPDVLPAGTFDIVVANILSNPLILLAPALAGRVRGSGRIALAGVLAAQEDSVASAYAPWFTLTAWRRDDGWVLLAGERRPVN
jgi:ribosomal protein L11 methyltransferase